jgi:hypothetical protein
MLRLPQNTALRAGLFMVCAMGSFVANDTIVKVVGQSLSVGEIILVVVVALLVGWILELLQRRDDAPVPDAADAGPMDAAAASAAASTPEQTPKR